VSLPRSAALLPALAGSPSLPTWRGDLAQVPPRRLKETFNFTTSIIFVMLCNKAMKFSVKLYAKAEKWSIFATQRV
jgi:hypothetical protein